jgi:hypothetical protein
MAKRRRISAVAFGLLLLTSGLSDGNVVRFGVGIGRNQIRIGDGGAEILAVQLPEFTR